jgi:hypothetical protein
VLRVAVAGRKNFYGSGSEWSGQLAAKSDSLCKPSGPVRRVRVGRYEIHATMALASVIARSGQAETHRPQERQASTLGV